VAAVYAQVRVRVVGFDDEPIENVRVFSEKDFGESVANGYFDLTIGAHVVRFSKDGFRPVTKLTADLQRVPEVRLAQDRAGLWKPPVCTTTKNSSVMDGWHMRFIVPRGVKVREGSDIDYSTQTVCRGRDCLQHGWGPLWSFGMPPNPEKFLTELTQVAERDIYNYNAPEFPGFEYRGIRKKEKYVRWVGLFGETIGYEDVSKESAQVFDILIDSFCWIENH
jgi:hypothetical protein